MIKSDERLDDLLCRGFKLIQNPNGYCFTSDSVLLANLAKIRKNDRVVDLCTGSGVIALLIAAKYSPEKVIGVEIQPALADRARRSVILNSAEQTVEIVNEPVQGVHKKIGCGFDAVTVNPPYDTPTDKDNPTEIDICKAEYKLKLEEVISESAKLLRFGGDFYMINKARRVIEALGLMREHGIEPKTLTFIHPKKDRAADTFIVFGKRGGRAGLTVNAPIVVFNENGEYTPEVRSLYDK